MLRLRRRLPGDSPNPNPNPDPGPSPNPSPNPNPDPNPNPNPNPNQVSTGVLVTLEKIFDRNGIPMLLPLTLTPTLTLTP